MREETRVLFKVLLFGMILREAFSFWTGHPWDFEVWVRVGYFTSRGISPYGLLDPVPGLSFSGEGTMTSIGYPPLWAFITALLYDIYSLIGGGNRFVYYFLLKQPSILGDLTAGYLLFQIVKERGTETALSAVRFWIFCPFTVVLSSIWGIFDGLSVALILAALLTLKHAWKSGSLIGIGGYLKVIPLIFAPVLLAFGDRKRSLIFLGLMLGIPIGLSTLPFPILGWEPSDFLLMARSQSSRPGEGMTPWFIFQFLPTIPPGSLFDLLLLVASVAWIPILLFTYANLAGRRKAEDSIRWTTNLFLVVISVFLISRLYVPEQYAIYPIAFLILDTYMWHPNRRKLLDATWIVAMAFLIVNNPLLIRFISPAIPWAWQVDLAINNLPPTATVRYTVMLVLGCAFFLTMIQVVKTYYTDEERQVQPLVLKCVRLASTSVAAKWYAAYLILFICFSLSVNLIIAEVVTDWTVAVSRPALLNLNFLALYHLSLGLSILALNAFISNIRGRNITSKFRTFLNLFSLNALGVGFDLPLYSLIRGHVALSGRMSLGYIDERVLFMASILLAFGSLLLAQNLPTVDIIFRRSFSRRSHSKNGGQSSPDG